ncbi:hypothetical protein [Desulfosporosinus sp. FKA]|uniref:hypothetical protein n=1 Tax=Desulfosporosinus sp. FKA TaxID=1969834 RepID=UPI000B49E112|nr:hypothetical protein [Desulfosporosinus sp. FKA]
MRDVKLGNWTVRCYTENYTIWANQNEESVMIEFNQSKIATLNLRDDGYVFIQSVNANCEVHSEQHLIIISSPNDKNIFFE